MPSPPRDTAIVGRHFFFQLEVFKSEAVYEISRDVRILHVDFDKGTESFLELPGASRWDREKFEFMHTHDGNTNEVHFQYYHYGDRLVEGHDYPQAIFYAFNVQTRSIQPAPEGDNDTIGEFKAHDGQFVWFAGYNTPFSGNRLMKSPFNNERTQLIEDPKAKNTVVLKRFSRLSGRVFRLVQMSPCRRYALVREEAQKFGDSPINTHYIVNVMNGATRILLKDEVRRKTDGAVSQIHWIP